MDTSILVRNARLHNLESANARIPKDSLAVTAWLRGHGSPAVKTRSLTHVEARRPACPGRRCRGQVLAVRSCGYDVSQVVGVTVDEALTAYTGVPAAAPRL